MAGPDASAANAEVDLAEMRYKWARWLLAGLIAFAASPLTPVWARPDTPELPPTPGATVPDPGPRAAPALAPGLRVRDTYAGGSILLEQSFFSPAVSQEISYWILLPPAYETSIEPYPALYLLHGLDADSSQWPTLGLGAAADELMAADLIEPLLIVFPFGSNSYYVNQPDGARWADHIRYDVVADVDARYRTIPEAGARAIGGLSMGGDAALRFALADPDIFGVVGAHSPSIRRSFADAPAGVFVDQDAFNEASPLWLVEHTDAASRLTIWLDIGDGDPWWWSIEEFHDRLAEQGVPHEFHYFVGEHDDTYWSAHVGEYLAFYAAALHG